jgi:hypothetical protein
MLRALILAFATLAPFSAIASQHAKPLEQDADDSQTVAAFIKAGERVLNDFAAVERISLHGNPPDVKAAIDDLVPAKIAFPNAAAAALRAADDNANLRQAVKEYFEAGTACIDSASNSRISTRKLCDEMRVKGKSLELELQVPKRE